MTSKQAINDLIDEIKYTHNDGVSLTPFDQKRVDAIMKDLEVLEIFKKYITIFENPNTVEKFRYVYTSSYLTKEEYDLLKEWLDNE